MSVEKELEIVRERSGGNLTAAAVVEFARDPQTFLHKRFEWDDSAAAERWRLEQARQLIIHVKVTRETTPDTNVTVRAYAALPSARRAYQHIDAVMADNSKREELLAQARADLRAFRRKYAALGQLSGVLHAIDAVLGDGTQEQAVTQ